MLNYIRINRSDAVIIHHFYEIVTIAKTLKGCKLYVLSVDGYMYGFSKDDSNTKFVKVPDEYLQSFDFAFRIDSIQKEIIPDMNYLFFPLYSETNWFLIPENIQFEYLEESINFNILENDPLSNDEFKLDLRSNVDNNIIDEIIPIYYPKSEKIIDHYSANNIIKGIRWINTFPISLIYNNFENNEIVKDIQSHKVNYGRKYLTLQSSEGTKYIMSLDKTILNINKNDTIELNIIDNPSNPSIYHSIFRIHKKKNPIPKIIKGQYIINIAVSYLHIS